ncbi:MAG: SRPBCC family protein [Pseudomonadota bacterium]
MLHTKTFGAQFSAEAKDIICRPGGVVTYFYKAGAPVPDGKSLFGRMPWIDDKGDDFACTARLPPNTHLFGRCDSVRYLVIWPTAVDRCRIIAYHLFPTERFALPDFAARNQVYRDFQVTVLEEDRPMVVSLQQAMGSRNYTPGPMAGLEATIHHVLNGLISTGSTCHDGAGKRTAKTRKTRRPPPTPLHWPRAGAIQHPGRHARESGHPGAMDTDLARVTPGSPLSRA